MGKEDEGQWNTNNSLQEKWMNDRKNTVVEETDDGKIRGRRSV